MKNFIYLLLLFVSIITVNNTAYAVGLGIYGSGGTSLSNWKYDDNKYNCGNTTDYFYGGGFIVDSAVAKNQLLNYRFSMGYEQYGSHDPSIHETESSNRTAHKFDMSHTFGFGLVKSAAIRFWIGPQIGAHCLYSLNFPHDRYSIIPPYYIYSMLSSNTGSLLPVSHTKKLLAVGIDALLAIGININIGDYTTLFAEVGFGYMGTYNINGIKETGNGYGLKGKIGIMFRINDAYAAAQDKI
jgi:hypothetical protein